VSYHQILCHTTQVDWLIFVSYDTKFVFRVNRHLVSLSPGNTAAWGCCCRPAPPPWSARSRRTAWAPAGTAGEAHRNTAPSARACTATWPPAPGPSGSFAWALGDTADEAPGVDFINQARPENDRIKFHDY
jgi:hypothetical protein